MLAPDDFPAPGTKEASFMAKIALITADHDLFEQTERICREISL